MPIFLDLFSDWDYNQDVRGSVDDFAAFFLQDGMLQATKDAWNAAFAFKFPHPGALVLLPPPPPGGPPAPAPGPPPAPPSAAAGPGPRPPPAPAPGPPPPPPGPAAGPAPLSQAGAPLSSLRLSTTVTAGSAPGAPQPLRAIQLPGWQPLQGAGRLPPSIASGLRAVGDGGADSSSVDVIDSVVDNVVPTSVPVIHLGGSPPTTSQDDDIVIKFNLDI